MSLDFMKEKGIKLEEQKFDWRDIVRVPTSKLDDDAFTRVRIILMSGIESETLRFQHACARMNKDLQLALARVRRVATMQTPSADVGGVLSHGILQIVSDPRTTLTQTLQAMLNAELADNDGWQMLINLASALGRSELKEQFEKAFEEEQEHLVSVRGWLSSTILNQITALGGNPVLEDVGKDRPRKTRRPPGRKSSPSKKKTRKN